MAIDKARDGKAGDNYEEVRMGEFETLFGVKGSCIRRTCVLTPFLTRKILVEFRIDKLSKGALYATGDNGLFSLIHTGIGAGALGDAVLCLDKTPCEDLILFGSCGAVRESPSFGIGGMVLVEKALSQDSFVEMLDGKRPKGPYRPDKYLFNRFWSLKNEHTLRKANCLTVASIKLEERYIEFIDNGSIDVVDMETSALFAASKLSKKKGVSILFVSDILKRFPYHLVFKKENMPKFKDLAGRASKTVCELIEKSIIG